MAASGAAAFPAPRMRLTRRGRAVILGFLLVVNIACGILLASASRAADPVTGPPPAAVVGPHDTLWSIAVRHDSGRAPAAVVAEIRRLNGLSCSVIHPGQRLVLPRAS